MSTNIPESYSERWQRYSKEAIRRYYQRKATRRALQAKVDATQASLDAAIGARPWFQGGWTQEKMAILQSLARRHYHTLTSEQKDRLASLRRQYKAHLAGEQEDAMINEIATGHRWEAAQRVLRQREAERQAASR